MNKTYDPHAHGFVTINHPTAKHGEGWDGTFEIILHTGNRVWVGANYAHERTPEIFQVGDGQSKGYDADGNCVLSVPAAWCKFYTMEEAESIEQCIDADDRLLSYAR